MTTGQRGEQCAADYLTRQGYTVICRNYRTRYGEIDLICENQAELLFVEVKTRSGCRFGEPREAVTRAKQRKIILTAQQWLIEHATNRQPRFDVVEVWISLKENTCRVEYIPNAFEVF